MHPLPPTAPVPSINAMPRPMPPAPGKGEPEDIFSDLDQSGMKRGGMGAPPGGVAPKRGGGFGKFFIITFVVVLVAALVGFVFWFLVVKGPTPQPAAIPEQQASSSAEQAVSEPTNSQPAGAVENLPPVEQPSSTETSTPTSSNELLPPPVTTPPPGASVPLPQSIQPDQQATTSAEAQVDTDHDGLSDQRERELGTDPNNPDTDGDGLSDGDEVLKYGTNPLNKDTDGDGFDDGTEVKNGYNPRGPGKCAKADCSL